MSATSTQITYLWHLDCLGSFIDQRWGSEEARKRPLSYRASKIGKPPGSSAAVKWLSLSSDSLAPMGRAATFSSPIPKILQTRA